MDPRLDRDVLKSLGDALRKERAADADRPLPDALRRLCEDMKRTTPDDEGRSFEDVETRG